MKDLDEKNKLNTLVGELDNLYGKAQAAQGLAVESSENNNLIAVSMSDKEKRSCILSPDTSHNSKKQNVVHELEKALETI